MNRKLPFEEAIKDKLQQAVLPDKEQSWQLMEALLNKKKKRRGAFYFKRFSAIAFLLAGGAAVLLLFIKKEYSIKKTTAINTREATNKNIDQQNNNTKGTTVNYDTYSLNKKADADIQNNTAIVPSLSADRKDKTVVNTSGKMKASFTNPEVEDGEVTHKKNITGTASSQIKESRDDKKVTGKTNEDEYSNNLLSTHKTTIEITPISADDTLLTKTSIDNNNYKTDSSGKLTNSIAAILVNDTTASKRQNEGFNDTLSKQKSKIRKYSWSTGIGLQQQIPIAGQKITTYGYNGGNRIIDNYVPSLYLRFQKNKQWFIQGEFSYGAPSSIAAFPYSRITKKNGISSEISTTTLTLRKIYYHELPITFNYFFSKQWSIGTGAMYGILHRAVTEKNTITKNIQNQQQSTVSSIIPSPYTDSFIYKAQWHYILQTGYEWKRLSVGLRYSIDMQPYIKYTLPTGELYQRKNKTLDVLIRFRIF
jgi:hypothetical protein